MFQAVVALENAAQSFKGAESPVRWTEMQAHHHLALSHSQNAGMLEIHLNSRLAKKGGRTGRG
jgi:hypothetical protein